jgi:hypothetical protein
MKPIPHIRYDKQTYCQIHNQATSSLRMVIQGLYVPTWTQVRDQVHLLVRTTEP